MGKTCENCIHFCVCVFRDGTPITASCCAFYEQNKRPHGEWIGQSDNYGNPYYECSVCEDAFITLEGTPKENHYNFCPNCGADMRKSGDPE